jgi:signal transduction histidine kinase
LYIVRTLVKRMHGQIVVRGRGSQSGTVFEVELPAAERLATPANEPGKKLEQENSA